MNFPRAIIPVTVFIILCFQCSAQSQLGIISDPDGFSLVRIAQSKESATVDTLYKEDFFYFTNSQASEWVKVTAWKGRQIEGFVHKSRVQPIEELSLETQKMLITKNLELYRSICYRAQQAWETKDNAGSLKISRERNLFSDTKFDPVLELMPLYFCKSRDRKTLQLFFSSLWEDRGSANEMPSFSMGSCFICQPDLVAEEINKLESKEQKLLLCEHIEWGLLNHFSVDESGNSKNPEYYRLRKKLDKSKAAAKPDR